MFSDIQPHAVKIGMIPNADAVHAVARGLRAWEALHVVLDPVMVATTGAPFLKILRFRHLKKN